MKLRDQRILTWDVVLGAIASDFGCVLGANFVFGFDFTLLNGRYPAQGAPYVSGSQEGTLI